MKELELSPKKRRNEDITVILKHYVFKQRNYILEVWKLKLGLRGRNQRKNILTHYQKNFVKIRAVLQWSWLPSDTGGLPLAGGAG